MKIGILDADLLGGGTRHPNLALMKLSGHYKDLGNEVLLMTDYAVADYDKVFLSKVFKFTELPSGLLSEHNVVCGGTGLFPNGGDSLPDHIEHVMPDYDLYKLYIGEKIAQGACVSTFDDYINFSIGFTTRGCFRKCDFCVNKKYDKAAKHSPISEFYDPARKGIYLWDDNFFAYGGWEDVLDEIEGTGKPFQFRQGLDIRLLNEQKTKRFAETKYHGDFIFAFDNLADRPLIEKKLALWRSYTDRSTKLYVFCGFNSQDHNDIESIFERVKVIMKYGCIPYIMRHENYKNSELETMYNTLARWCNQPAFFKKKSFREFCNFTQQFSGRVPCKAVEIADKFERLYPEISKRYYDMTFDQERRF